MSRQPPAVQLLSSLQSDLRNLSLEARRKHPAVKEASERGILKLRHYGSLPSDEILKALRQTDDVLHPLLFGCETKSTRLVQIALTALQRLITCNAVPESLVSNIVNMLWNLMVAGVEELRILQTVLLLLTATQCVHGDQLAKVLVLCLRLHTSKDSVISNTATATMRQLVTALFERMVLEEKLLSKEGKGKAPPPPSSVSRKLPVNLSPCAQDAYLVFQDLCQLTNGDLPYWLTGVDEISRTLGLELLETLLGAHPHVFLQVPEFSFMLKERVCPLVIKLFSPSIKYHSSAGSLTPSSGGIIEKPSFPVCLRLLRVVGVLIKHFYVLLVTECEIFLSLLVKFLEIDKPLWQKVLAVEVLHQLAVQPRLLRSFCYFYDLQEQSTKVFSDIISSLHMFIESQLQPQTMKPAQAALPSPVDSPPINTLQSGSGVAVYTEGFLYGGSHHAVQSLPPVGTARAVLIQMLDKIESPQVPEGYALSEAITCLLDTVHSVGQASSSPENDKAGKESHEQGAASQNGSTGLEDCGASVIGVEADSERVVKEMVQVSWKDILSSLTLLLDTSQVDSVSDMVLHAVQTMVGLCGRLELYEVRGSFLAALCRSAQPFDHLAHTTAPVTEDRVVKIPAKKLLCTRCLLSIAFRHGQVLDKSWYPLLLSVQTTFSALGLQVAENVMSDVDLGGASLVDSGQLLLFFHQLCQNSSDLCEEALLSLLDALCILIREAQSEAVQGKEPIFFPVQALVLCCKHNLARVMLIWKKAVTTLLQGCQISHSPFREVSAKAITSLIVSALQTFGTQATQDPESFHEILLSLEMLGKCSFADVGQCQMECVLEVLHSFGDTVHNEWPLLLSVIGGAAQLPASAVVQLGFEALQLVVADFLVQLPSKSLSSCLDVAAAFGLQNQDLNISLTSIGLMWNMSDFLCQQRSMIEESLPKDFRCSWSEGKDLISVVRPYDWLWCALFHVLSQLCVDHRAAVRKSAAQTLFSTLDAHSHVLEKATWHVVLWQVLFPLLEQVQRTLQSVEHERQQKASIPSGQDSVVILHHSRNTERKQWAETQVLTLQGISGVFRAQLHCLAVLDGFHRAWDMLLSAIHACVSDGASEVAMAALRSLQQLLMAPVLMEDSQRDLWQQVWQVWKQLGLQAVQLANTGQGSSSMDRSSLQSLLTLLLQQFPSLRQHVGSDFGPAHIQQLHNVISAVLAVPADQVTLLTSTGPTPLQQGCIQAIRLLCTEQKQAQASVSLLRSLFELLLQLTSYCTSTPEMSEPPCKEQVHSFILFGEELWRMTSDLYQAVGQHALLQESNVFLSLLKALHIPLACKYSCSEQSTWQLTLHVLLDTVPIGLECLRKHPQLDSAPVYEILLQVVEDFLFPASDLPNTLSAEQRFAYEALDVKVIELVRDELLSHAQHLPPTVISSAVTLLSRGSVLAQTSPLDVSGTVDSSILGREQVARSCFETLLNCSVLMQGQGYPASVALGSLVERCRTVLLSFSQEERLTGNCPLPRSQLAETAFVLRAVGMLLSSMKSSPPTDHTKAMWQQLIELYPSLVECVTCQSLHIRTEVSRVLSEYASLLSVPSQ